MGGYGSGRPGWHATVEASLTLDLVRMMRRAWIVPGRNTSGNLIWNDTRNGEHIASIRYEAQSWDAVCPWMRLHYTRTQHHDGSRIAWDYRVQLATTHPYFGGVRWWFVCPLTGRRTLRLHLPNGADRFASRQAYGLVYQSQRTDDLGLAQAREARITRKMGGQWLHPDMPPPPRPKWMRHKTYQRLSEEHEAAGRAQGAAFMADAERLLARLAVR